MTLTSDLGCFLFDNRPSRPLSVYHTFFLHFHSLVELPSLCAVLHSVLYYVRISRPMNDIAHRSPLWRTTSIVFAENQLFPSSIGFLPLTTDHPRFLPQSPVRSSTCYWAGFKLPMVRSLGFGFYLTKRSIKTHFHYTYVST